MRDARDRARGPHRLVRRLDRVLHRVQPGEERPLGRPVLGRAGQVTGGLPAGVLAAQGFRHLEQLELLAALRGAKAKPIGDAWVWSRRASSGDAALVIAMTLALTAGAKIEADASGPVID